MRQQTRMVVSSMSPLAIYKAEELAYEFGDRLGLDRMEIAGLVAAVARMTTTLMRVAGAGRLVFTGIERAGVQGLEVSAESEKQAWSPSKAELPEDTAGLVDELIWDMFQAGGARLVARKWRQQEVKSQPERNPSMAKRNKNAKSNASTKPLQSGPAVRIEYPADGETLTHPHYTFQIATLAGTNGVEVSIDHGDWQPCRESLGLWWCDWSGFSKGEHVVVARTQTGEGISITSAPRHFTVSDESTP